MLVVSRATAAEAETGPSGPTPLPVAEPARVSLTSLDTLWFQVGGTLCNLTCSHCFISCSPTNRTHEILSLETVLSYLDEAVNLGVGSYLLKPCGVPDVLAAARRALGAAVA